MPWIEDFGQQAAGGLLGAGMGLILQKSNDERQYNQQQRLQALQMQGNRQMMDYSYQKQLEMWKATNYAEQMKQMKMAGLSPGLMYGMKGGGGVTTGSPSGSVQGANAPAGGREIPEMMGMGMQLQLLQAQKENIEADTANKKAQATKTGGVDTQLGETQIMDLMQGIENKKAQQRFTQVQTRIEDIRERIAYITEDSAIEQISAAADEARMQARIAQVRKEITEQTAKDTIKKVHVELIRLGLENALTYAQTTTEQGKPSVQKAEIRHLDNQSDALIRQHYDELEKLYQTGIDTNTKQAAQQQDAWAHDLAESTKLPLDVVEKILQAIVFKGAVNTPTTPRKTQTDPNFWKHRSTDIIK